MRSKLILLATVGLLAEAGCATTTKTCRPLMTWSAPGSACAIPSTETPVAAQPETPAPQPAKRVQVTQKKIEITEIVQFETNKAVLLPASERLLDEVVDALRSAPDVEEVRVEGHTDSQGAPKFNLKLSEARANAVKDYLVSKGIDGKRLVTEGFGETKPVADNETEEGRYKNRRVEFEITKRK